jgi:hypothetical protein
VSDGWTIADLRASAIFDATRTGAVAERNGRTLAKAAGLPPSPVLTADFGPMSSGPIPAPAPSPPPGGASKPGTLSSTVGQPSADSRPLVDQPDGWLHRLMACDGWSDRKRRLSPEEQLSALVATELRRLTLAGELRAAWTCHRVEHAGGDAIGRMIQRLQRVLGVVPGAPDYWFAWGSGAGLIELKVERAADLLDLRKDGTARAPTRTYMRPVQRDFREWAVSNGVRHEVCRSLPEVLAALREWGRL